MTEVARALLDNAEAFRWIFLLALLWVFYRWMQTENGINWRDFVSAEKPDGTYRGDINRVGQSVGVVVAAFSIIATAPKAHTDYAGFALVLTACLAFLGGVAAYAATLRAKSGRSERTVVEEPIPTKGPTRTTTTTTEPADSMPSQDVQPVVIVGGPGKDEPLKTQEQGNPR